jgi:hypothetical protein
VVSRRATTGRSCAPPDSEELVNFAGAGRAAGRLPAALALSRSPLSCVVELTALLGFSDIGETGRWDPSCLELKGTLLSLGPTSDPAVEFCELCRRGMAGRRLDADEATKAADFFLGVPPVDFLGFSFALDPLESCFKSVTALVGVLSEVANSLSPISSSPSDLGGDANLAVGRGPDVEGPLGFFRIGCAGGGLDEDDGIGLIDPLSLGSSASPWAPPGVTWLCDVMAFGLNAGCDCC